jgi:hypothetical protein
VPTEVFRARNEQPRTPKEAEWRFRTLDQNGDGLLNYDEILADDTLRAEREVRREWRRIHRPKEFRNYNAGRASTGTLQQPSRTAAVEHFVRHRGQYVVTRDGKDSVPARTSAAGRQGGSDEHTRAVVRPRQEVARLRLAVGREEADADPDRWHPRTGASDPPVEWVKVSK